MANGEDPDEIKKRSEATEENTEAVKDNTDALEKQAEAQKEANDAAEQAAATQEALAKAGKVSRRQFQEIVEVLEAQLQGFENVN